MLMLLTKTQISLTFLTIYSRPCEKITDEEENIIIGGDFNALLIQSLMRKEVW